LLTGQWSNITGAQRSSKVTWFSISPVHAGTSGPSEESRRGLKHLAQFGQPTMKGDGLTTGGSLHDRNERAPRLKRVSAERDKERNGRARRFSKEQNQEQDVGARRFLKEQDDRIGSHYGGSPKTLANGSEHLLGNRIQLAPETRRASDCETIRCIHSPKGFPRPQGAALPLRQAASSPVPHRRIPNRYRF
jgi:hypothetical protein